MTSPSTSSSDGLPPNWRHHWHNLSCVISVGTALVAGGVVWGLLSGRVVSLEAQASQVEVTQTRQAEKTAEVSERLARVEGTLSSIIEQLKRIERKVTD